MGNNEHIARFMSKKNSHREFGKMVFYLRLEPPKEKKKKGKHSEFSTPNCT